LLYYSGILEIHRKHENLKLIYDDFKYLNNWQEYLSGKEAFARAFYMFLRDYKYAENVKMLNTTSALWRDWRRYALQMWHIDMSPTPKKIEQMKAEDEQKAIDSARQFRQAREAEKRAREAEEAKHLEELLD